ncbi:MAG TPA: DUF4440 domain-containing protein [Candidatus Limnocylindrales bacterium]|nr:DUF4440 domain-containing protein [Candidatus Limnocylindrales bacterium]
MLRTWCLSAAALALLVVGAVSAESDPEKVALSMPAPALVNGPAASAADAAKVRFAIEKANAQWLAAFQQNDATALARIYADDATLFPPSNVGLEGRDSIVEYFQAQRKAGMGDATLKTLDVVCVGDVAYEVGTYGFRFGSSAAADAGRYFAIWKGLPDGSWHYQVGIWSSNRDVAVEATDRR